MEQSTISTSGNKLYTNITITFSGIGHIVIDLNSIIQYIADKGISLKTLPSQTVFLYFNYVVQNLRKYQLGNILVFYEFSGDIYFDFLLKMLITDDKKINQISFINFSEISHTVENKRVALVLCLEKREALIEYFLKTGIYVGLLEFLQFEIPFAFTLVLCPSDKIYENISYNSKLYCEDDNSLNRITSKEFYNNKSFNIKEDDKISSKEFDSNLNRISSKEIDNSLNRIGSKEIDNSLNGITSKEIDNNNEEPNTFNNIDFKEHEKLFFDFSIDLKTVKLDAVKKDLVLFLFKNNKIYFDGRIHHLVSNGLMTNKMSNLSISKDEDISDLFNIGEKPQWSNMDLELIICPVYEKVSSKHILNIRRSALSLYNGRFHYSSVIKESSTKEKISPKILKIIEENEKLLKAEAKKKDDLWLRNFFNQYTKLANLKEKKVFIENVTISSDYIKRRILLLKIELCSAIWSLEKKKDEVDESKILDLYLSCMKYFDCYVSNDSGCSDSKCNNKCSDSNIVFNNNSKCEFTNITDNSKCTNTTDNSNNNKKNTNNNNTNKKNTNTKNNNKTNINKNDSVDVEELEFVATKMIEAGFESTVLEILDNLSIKNLNLSFSEKAKKEPNDFDLYIQLKYAGEHLKRTLGTTKDKRVPFDPDRWQAQLLDAVDSNKSALISAPTSSGKTFICFYAIEKVLKNSDTDVVIFCMPTKALVNQVSSDIYARFNPKNIKVSLQGTLMPDKSNESFNCQVLITIPAMLEGLLNSKDERSKNLVKNIKYIIIDEIHKINDPVLGIKIERIIHLSKCPMLLLSATLGNLDVFYEWVSSIENKKGREVEKVIHTERYCELKSFVYSPSTNSIDRCSDTNTNDNIDKCDDIKADKCDDIKVDNTNKNINTNNSFTNNTNNTFTNSLNNNNTNSNTNNTVTNNSNTNNINNNNNTNISTSNEGKLTGINNMFAYSYNHLATFGFGNDLYFLPDELLQIYYYIFMVLEPEKKKLAKNLAPKRFFKSNIICKKDVEQYQKHLLSTFEGWVKQNILNESQVREVHGLLVKEATCAFPTDISEKYILDNILGLLNTLKNSNKLPVIVFNTNRDFITKLGKAVFNELENMDFRKKKDKALEKFKKEVKRNRDAEKTKNSWIEDSIQLEQSLEMQPQARDINYTFLDPLTKLTDYDVKQELHDDIPKDFYEMAFRGIGIHHQAMSRKYRSAVEILFRKKHIRVLFATDTLALGINMPCRTVVFAGDSLYLDPMNFKQMSGRAGRRGYDTLGNIVFFGVSKTRVQNLMVSNLPEIQGAYIFSNSTLTAFNSIEESVVDYPLLSANKSNELLIDKNTELFIDNSKDKSIGLVIDRSNDNLIDNNKDLVIDRSKDKSKDLVVDKSKDLIIDRSKELVIDNSNELVIDKDKDLVIDPINCTFDALDCLEARRALIDLQKSTYSFMYPSNYLWDIQISNRDFDPGIFIFSLMMEKGVLSFKPLYFYNIISHLFETVPVSSDFEFKLPELTGEAKDFFKKINTSYINLIKRYYSPSLLSLQSYISSPLFYVKSFLYTDHCSLNSYIFEFFISGSVYKINKNNKIPTGALWLALSNVNNFLKSFIRFLETYHSNDSGLKSLIIIHKEFTEKFDKIQA